MWKHIPVGAQGQRQSFVHPLIPPLVVPFKSHYQAIDIFLFDAYSFLYTVYVSNQKLSEEAIVTKKKKKKIAIVGFAASSVGDAPFQDETWEIWGLNELWRGIPKRGSKRPLTPEEILLQQAWDKVPNREDGEAAWDRWFDVHPRWSWERHAGHTAWLQKQDGKRPVYMQEKYKEIPASQPIPKDELWRKFGPYFTCGPAYMLAMAILEKPNQIGVWGIDMLHDSEYAYQRACCDYYIGFARGAGIAVYVPDTSALGKASGWYGYDNLGPAPTRYVQRRYSKRKQYLSDIRDAALKVICETDGAIQTIDQFGVGDDIIGILVAALRQEKFTTTDRMYGVLRHTFEAYRSGLKTHVQKQREQAMTQLYNSDGAVQEFTYHSDIVKHLQRGWV
jgi:hypothetical protein